jgi:hypothetical protein
MTRSNISTLPIGQMAIITGIVYILAAILLILFFVFGQPFGTLNDFFNGLAGISSGILALMLFRRFQTVSPLLSRIGIMLAAVGAIAIILGSMFVISRMTGWVLAGLYTSAGNALIGLWLLTLNYSLLKHDPLPRNLLILGLVSGVLLTSGLVVLPGIISGYDSEDTIPWYLYVAGLNALSGAILYPVWCIWLGRTILLTQKLTEKV